jgi:hypothetical protein
MFVLFCFFFVTQWYAKFSSQHWISRVLSYGRSSVCACHALTAQIITSTDYGGALIFSGRWCECWSQGRGRQSQRVGGAHSQELRWSTGPGSRPEAVIDPILQSCFLGLRRFSRVRSCDISIKQCCFLWTNNRCCFLIDQYVEQLSKYSFSLHVRLWIMFVVVMQ